MSSPERERMAKVAGDECWLAWLRDKDAREASDEIGRLTVRRDEMCVARDAHLTVVGQLRVSLEEALATWGGENARLRGHAGTPRAGHEGSQGAVRAAARPDGRDAQRARMALVRELLQERAAQDKRWGGAEHDDQHQAGDWRRFLSERVDQIDGVTAETRRRLLVEVAALALAAIESQDRAAAKEAVS